MRGYPVFKGQFFDAPLDYIDLFTRQLTAGPQEVLELKVL
jgi:hypothetical protein